MSRLSLRTLIAGVILSVTLGLSAVPPASAAPVVPAAGYGFTEGALITTLSQADIDREMNVVAQTNAKWFRVLIDRSTIETSPGVYNWGPTDRVVNAARKRGLSVIGLIAFTPLLQGGGLLRTAPPARATDFSAFAARAVQRYRGSSSTWEIWNEPNLPAFFGLVANKPARYVALLRATYPVIKRIQPRSTVIAAGLSPLLGSDSPPQFMRDIYRLGAKRYFDAAAMHPYVFPSGFAKDPLNAFSDVARVRDIMVRNGDAGKKIWFTEFGAPTNGPRFGGNTPIQQRDQIKEGLARIARLPYAGPVIIYSIRDYSNDPRTLNDRETRFGALLTYDYKLKPTFDLLRR
ncbi:hypothetical protein [Williamsia sp.]|uniref:hypothetical protein n=1 Tax=Williamsia sp. TaxID=1872085 RepID=UPI001A1B7259|nr:hypothetical protein [Williamsia sp.]MBJ7291584.1 hypothetical protein [Williamsia sp.]